VPLLVRIVPLAFQHALREITASAAARLVGIAGIGCTLVDGTALRLQHHILRIDFACTAIDLTAMFVILVLAMPIATKRKVQGLVVGVPTVLTANLGRLVMVAGVSQWAPEQFGWVHGLLFVALMAVFVAGAWGVWLRISRNDWDEGWDS
jgi:exosortase/archaeosortase family protein